MIITCAINHNYNMIMASSYAECPWHAYLCWAMTSSTWPVHYSQFSTTKVQLNKATLTLNEDVLKPCNCIICIILYLYIHNSMFCNDVLQTLDWVM